jgi:hypothetical protein
MASFVGASRRLSASLGFARRFRRKNAKAFETAYAILPEISADQLDSPESSERTSQSPSMT